ncbi:hypothetical protein KUTeg_018882 [Tegillarca granosa]|uniref:Uncharacterized protein n=1 Tax=Tegillarca granosa TaxID=220873 RepID=A0ABQ9EF56_TEGGR|nr:hypothetical protein KUTeg_018882 [Tegillarca granosa]
MKSCFKINLFKFMKKDVRYSGNYLLYIILPRLAAMAIANNHVTNETKKRDIAIQLFEAYSAMSLKCPNFRKHNHLEHNLFSIILCKIWKILHVVYSNI